MPPESISTQPCEVHLIDTSPLATSATTNEDGRRAFARYIADCEKCAIVPDVAGAFHWAWTYAAPVQQEAADPHRARLAEQAGAIDIDQLSRALVALGISQPEGREELAARVGLFVNSLTFFAALTPPAVAAPAADGPPLEGLAHFHYRLEAVSGYEQEGVYNNITADGFGRVIATLETAHRTNAELAAPAQAVETPVAAEDLVLLARSLEIADAAMLDVLTNNCVAQDEHGLTLGLTDANAREVHTLAEADPQIAEAFFWLHERGYVVLATDSVGEHIVVERRPGE